MTVGNRFSTALAVGLIALSQHAAANPEPLGTATAVHHGAMPTTAAVAKAASAQSFGSRGTVTSSATMYGAFELAANATVYILVRGNSLQTLGVTQNYLDAPRVRLFDAQGQDLITDSFGRPGFNSCVSGNSFNQPVITYYQSVRGQPAHERDGCFGGTFPAGVYTFSVTPSIVGVTTTSGSSNPAAGEVLFEITLNP